MPPAVHFLVDHRRFLDDLASGSFDDEVAVAIEREIVGARDGHLDARGVGIRRDPEVIFEAALRASINQADAGIDALEAHAFISCDAGMPLRAVLADEIVAMPGQRIDATGS